jgi:biopolymer transport protein ExbD
MTGFENDDEDEGIAQINVVPFVDIVLVLLIIFLLTSSIIARGSFTIDLPQAAHAGQAVDSTVNIVVAPGGSLFLDGEALVLADLGGRIAPRIAHDAKLRAVIAADKSLRYEQVVAVIDTVKGAGVTAFALNIDRGPGGSGAGP